MFVMVLMVRKMRASAHHVSSKKVLTRGEIPAILNTSKTSEDFIMSAKLLCVSVDFELADSFIFGKTYHARYDGTCYYVEDEDGVEWAILPDDKCFEVIA